MLSRLWLCQPGRDRHVSNNVPAAACQRREDWQDANVSDQQASGSDVIKRSEDSGAGWGIRPAGKSPRREAWADQSTRHGPAGPQHGRV